MGKGLGLAIGKDQRQFVRKPLPVMQDPGAIFFLFLPMVGELNGSPVGNVPVFTFAKDAVQHACRAEQSNVAAMQRREWSASDILLLREKDAACLTIGRRLQQQVFNFIQWNSGVDERDWA